MKHHASAKFWTAYHALPQDIQKIADKNFAILKANPFHPSLHFKKVGSYWSVSPLYRSPERENSTKSPIPLDFTP